MHESLRYLLEKVLSKYTTEEFYPALVEAKDDYFVKTGKAFEEDGDYEGRMSSFNDWYVLQYPHKKNNDGTKTTLFDTYLRSHSVLPELVKAVKEVNHSLFEYTGTSFRNYHVLKDILHDEKVTLAKEHWPPSMVKGDLFIGRTIQYIDENYLFPGLRILPKEAYSPMKKEAKKVRKFLQKREKERNKLSLVDESLHSEESRLAFLQEQKEIELDFLLFTESLKTRWQRYGHVDVNKIFVYPEERLKSFEIKA